MKYKYSILYVIFCICLFIGIINWGTYLINNYIYTCNKEGFDVTNYYLYRGDTNTPLTSHSVDLPINTTYQCKNFCGPNSQCSITREQCTSDVDCYGCQPLPKYLDDTQMTKDVEGQNDAGKLTYNQNPQYSKLTTDIGTNATIYNKKLALIPKPYYGIDNWMKSANIGMQLFKKKENYMLSRDPSKTIDIPVYPVRESATGLFEDYGPLPSNAYL